MSNAAPDTMALVRLGQESDRARKACERIQGVAKSLEVAVQRSLPYLARKRVPVSAARARTALFSEALTSFTKPCHVTPLAAGARGIGALVLDGPAVACVLDGVLSGGGALGGTEITLSPDGLSPAQVALASSVSRGLLAAFDEVLRRVGTPLAFLPDASPERHGGLFVVCAIRIGDGDTAATISLLIPVASIEVAVTPPAAQLDATADPAAEAAVANVEVEVVAELGRVRVPLGRLAELRPGDVLRLPLAVDANATVRVGGRVLAEGRPTTRGVQIAIELTRHDA